MEESVMFRNTAYVATNLHVVIFENYTDRKCVVDKVALREGAVPAPRLSPVAVSFHHYSILIHLAPNPYLSIFGTMYLLSLLDAGPLLT
jgi:hypothetical protein